MTRSFGIDLVRTFAIIIVIFRHCGFLPGFNFGTYAIEFLFVVSGYLIGQILIKDFYSTQFVETSSVKRFMMRRWFRILPLYYFAIIVKFIFHPDVGANIIYYVFFLQNHFYGISFFPETWSLVIDEWFYLGTPILLYLFMRFVSSKSFQVLLYFIGIIVVINILRFYWVSRTNLPWDALNGNIVLHQDTLLIGVILAFVKRKFSDLFSKFNSVKYFLVSTVFFIAHTFFIRSIRYPVDMIDDYFWVKVLDFSGCAFIIITMMPYIENSVMPLQNKNFKWFNKFIVWGSKLSYALYLAHNMAHELAVFILSPITNNQIITGIFAIGLSIFASHLMYQYIEKYFLILRDRYYPDRPELNVNLNKS
ncbi:MAG: acyltransferase [Bacteroidetes bacterium]|nr:acyltransferase [Bacteroidota bacterium]